MVRVEDSFVHIFFRVNGHNLGFEPHAGNYILFQIAPRFVLLSDYEKKYCIRIKQQVI